ncbi:hypothetical protein BD560DRAFT_236574 [Blakeslea trispora]|nr:hypothetical protein BD560DRAFT_236574 [Blakeslea trispora]
MDNGSFSAEFLSDPTNQTNGTVMDNGFSIASPSTGVMNQNDYSTMDTGISFDVPSSEPIHLSNEESDDEEEVEDN